MMALPIICTVTCASILMAVYAINRGIAKASDNNLINITLPHDALTDYTVMSIVKRFKIANNALFIVFFLLLIPFWLIMDYISFSILYAVLWLIPLICINQVISSKYARELYTLKKEKAWWVGTPHIISIDTEVSKLKDTFPVSKAWFVIPLLLIAISIISFAQSDWNPLYGGIVLHNLILFITFFLLYIGPTEKPKTH